MIGHSNQATASPSSDSSILLQPEQRNFPGIFPPTEGLPLRPSQLPRHLVTL